MLATFQEKYPHRLDTAVLATVHGSRLYGTHRADSDFDYYLVDTAQKTRQKISGDNDLTVVNIETFFQMVAKGVPQALEALFAPGATLDNTPYTHYLRGLRPGISVATDTYVRTIYSFSFTSGSRKQHLTKRRIHAVRLALNLTQMRSTGYGFNPQLDTQQRALCTQLAALPDEQYERHIRALIDTAILAR